MQALNIVGLVLLVGFCYGADDYSILDKIDMDDVLKHDRLLINYINCFLDKGPCTAEAADIKKLIPEGLKEHCGNCTPTQKKNVNKVIRYLDKNKPEIFKELAEKYDPEMTYRKTYADELKTPAD